MAISVFDLFKVGIGPSSSHTVGPMKAAARFAEALQHLDLLHRTAAIEVELYGSLAATGRGHGTDRAVVLGLEGEDPETVDVDRIDERVTAIQRSGTLSLLGRHPIAFREPEHLRFRKRERLPGHPNGMRFTARDDAAEEILARIYYSVGGGFVVDEHAAGEDQIVPDETPVPYPFHSAAELLSHCERHDRSIAEIMRANEAAWRADADVAAGLLHIWRVMLECIERGCRREGVLPGGLKVRRRAPGLVGELAGRSAAAQSDPLRILDHVDLWALAVNEENASGGRVVTAPTNGAAGILPAVLCYYDKFVAGACDDGIVRFLLTAGAIGVLYRENASISGAEVGCQGEVGVACSMAAGGLAEVMGGTPAQVENAAEIGMEHNLGLTCDPVGGLVQVPCIERNAMGAIKAINAARMALASDGQHFVSLDRVIRTMRQIGADMKTKYKETARGGLAVNVTEC